MDAQTLILFLIVGAIAGWLAGQIMKGSGFGLIGDQTRPPSLIPQPPLPIRALTTKLEAARLRS